MLKVFSRSQRSKKTKSVPSSCESVSTGWAFSPKSAGTRVWALKEVNGVNGDQISWRKLKSLWILAGPFPTQIQDHLQHIPSSSSRVTVGSTYSHQCLPSVETGISQLDHLQARWMHTQATTGGLYCRQNVVKCRLRGRIRPGRKRQTEKGGERTDIQYIEFEDYTHEIWKHAATFYCSYQQSHKRKLYSELWIYLLVAIKYDVWAKSLLAGTTIEQKNTIKTC